MDPAIQHAYKNSVTKGGRQQQNRHLPPLSQFLTLIAPRLIPPINFLIDFLSPHSLIIFFPCDVFLATASKAFICRGQWFGSQMFSTRTNSLLRLLPLLPGKQNCNIHFLTQDSLTHWQSPLHQASPFPWEELILHLMASPNSLKLATPINMPNLWTTSARWCFVAATTYRWFRQRWG